MATAFVLSGGGSLGAVQVGMLQALAARGVRPDVLIGTSAGAVNAVFVAGHGFDDDGLAALEAAWSGLRRRDVFPIEPARALAAAAGASPSLCSAAGLRRLVERHLTYDCLEQAVVPVHIVTTDVRSGEEVVLDRGSAVDAVLASAAIPAVFPAVTIDGRPLVDGGISDNASISRAVALGADRVYVLPTGYSCALDRAPTTALGNAMQALTLLIQQRLVLEVARYADQVDIRVLPPLCPLQVSSVDFRHGRDLVRRARDASGRWLDEGGDRRRHPERFLALHAHERRVPVPADAPAAVPAECPGGHAA